MLKSLQIRRLFLVVDLVLALGLAYMGYLVVGQTLGSGEGALVRASFPEATEAPAPQFARLAPRSAYDAVVAANLFGQAGRNAPPPALPPPPPTPVEVETTLPLALVGTSTAGDPISRFGSAIIRHNDSRRTDTYFVGQEILPQVTLQQVHDRVVLLENKRNNQIEQLFMDDDREVRRPPASAVPTAAGPAAAPPGSFATRVTLDRQEVLDDLFANYADAAGQLDAEFHMDERGNLAGVTASNWNAFPLAGQLGLQNGDVIQSVNNEVIDSEQKIMELMTKYRNASTFRLGILRDGQPRVMTVTLR